LFTTSLLCRQPRAEESDGGNGAGSSASAGAGAGIMAGSLKARGKRPIITDNAESEVKILSGTDKCMGKCSFKGPNLICVHTVTGDDASQVGHNLSDHKSSAKRAAESFEHVHQGKDDNEIKKALSRGNFGLHSGIKIGDDNARRAFAHF